MCVFLQLLNLPKPYVLKACSSPRQFCKGSSGGTEGSSTEADAGFGRVGFPLCVRGGTLTQRAASVVSSFGALAEGREEGVLLCTGLWHFPSRFPFPYS